MVNLPSRFFIFVSWISFAISLHNSQVSKSQSASILERPHPQGQMSQHSQHSKGQSTSRKSSKASVRSWNYGASTPKCSKSQISRICQPSKVTTKGDGVNELLTSDEGQTEEDPISVTRSQPKLAGDDDEDMASIGQRPSTAPSNSNSQDQSSVSGNKNGDKKLSQVTPARSSCCGYIDDVNRNILQFATSSSMLDFLFESNNLCDKSQEQLDKERAEGNNNDNYGISGISEKVVEAAASAASLALDFMLSNNLDTSRLHQNFSNSTTQSTVDQGVGPYLPYAADLVKSAIQFVNDGRKGNIVPKSNPSLRSKFSTPNKRPVADEIDSDSSETQLSSGKLKDDPKPLNQAECLKRLDEIADMCKLLGEDPLMEELRKKLTVDAKSQTQLEEDKIAQSQASKILKKTPLRKNKETPIKSNESNESFMSAIDNESFDLNETLLSETDDPAFVTALDEFPDDNPSQENIKSGPLNSMKNLSETKKNDDPMLFQSPVQNVTKSGLSSPKARSSSLKAMDNKINDKVSASSPEINEMQSKTQNEINPSSKTEQSKPAETLNITSLPTSKEAKKMMDSNTKGFSDVPLREETSPSNVKMDAETQSTTSNCTEPRAVSSSTIIQGLFKPFSQHTIKQLEEPGHPLTGQLDTGLLSELVSTPESFTVDPHQQVPVDAKLGMPQIQTKEQEYDNPTSESENKDPDILPDKDQDEAEKSLETSFALQPNPEGRGSRTSVRSLHNHITRRIDPQKSNKPSTSGGSSKSPKNTAPNDYMFQEVIINYMEEEIPYKDYLAKRILAGDFSQSKQKAAENGESLELKCVLTELQKSADGEMETILEINGQVVDIPKEMNSKQFLQTELYKMSQSGNNLKENLEKLSSFAEKSVYKEENLMQPSKQDESSCLEETTTIKMKEEIIPICNTNSGSKTIRNLECTLVDQKCSDNSSRIHPYEIKSLQVNGKYVNPISEPSVISCYQTLEQIEATLETIADDFEPLLVSKGEKKLVTTFKKRN